MARIADLSIGMSADSARLNKDLKKARKRTKKFSRGVSKDFKRLAAGIGAAFVVRGILNFSQELDNLIKTSRSVGVAAEDFQTLAYAANILGLEQEALSKILIKVGQSAGEAKRGTTTYLQALNAIGLTAGDIKGLSLDDTFVKIADALGDVSDQAVKTQAGVLLLGARGFKQLGTLSEAGADGISKLRMEAKRLGIVISEDSLEAAEDFNDSLARIGLQTQALAADGLGPVLVLFEGLTTSLSEFAAESPKLFAALTTTIVLLTGLAVVAGIAAIAIAAVGAVPALIAAAVIAVGALIYVFRDDIIEAFTHVVATIYEAGLNMKTIFTTLIPSGLTILANLVSVAFNGILLLIQSTLLGIGESARDLLDYLPGTEDVVKGIDESLQGLRDGVRQTKDEISANGKAIKDAGNAVVDGFKADAQAAEKYRKELSESWIGVEEDTQSATDKIVGNAKDTAMSLKTILAAFDPDNIDTGLLIENIQQKLDSRLEAIRLSLENQKITEAEAYQQQLDAYQSFEDDKTRIKEDAEQRRQDASYAYGLFNLKSEKDFSTETNKDKAKFFKTQLGELAKYSKTAFEANKALSIAEAIINTHTGVTAALKAGPIIGPILAGITLAAGLASVAAISSQQFNPPRQFGGSVQGGLPGLVGENGPEVFVPSSNGTILPNEADGGPSLGNTVNGNIIMNVSSDTDIDDLNEQMIDKWGFGFAPREEAYT